MRDKKWLWMLPIVLALLCVNLFSNSFGSADVGDFLGVAKAFSGNSISQIRSTHSWMWGLFLQIPLKIYYSPISVKLFNVAWLILTIVALYLYTRDTKTMFLFLTAPIVWYMAPWISPILPATFFMFFAYVGIKNYEDSLHGCSPSLLMLIFSGMSFGFALWFWDSMVYILPIFVLCFFLDKEVMDLLAFLIPLITVLSMRFLFDYILFGNPFYSLFKAVASSLLQMLHLGAYSAASISLSAYAWMLVGLSPFFLVFLIMSLKKREEFWPEILFISFTFVLFILNPHIRYLLVIAPIVAVVFGKVLSDEAVLWHVMISLTLIFLLITPFFGQTYESKITSDINKIVKQYPNQTFVAGSERNTELYSTIAMNYWGHDFKELVSYQDYKLWALNQTTISLYSFSTQPKSNFSLDKEDLSFGLSRGTNRTYEDVKYLITDDAQAFPGFIPWKDYDTLHVFRKAHMEGNDTFVLD